MNMVMMSSLTLSVIRNATNSDGATRSFLGTEIAVMKGLDKYMFPDAAKAAGKISTGFLIFSIGAEMTQNFAVNKSWQDRLIATGLTAGKYGTAYGTGLLVGTLNLQPITGIPTGLAAGWATGKLYESQVADRIRKATGVKAPYGN